jgi:hypothetical protein
MSEGKSNNKKTKGNKKDYIFLPLIFIGVVIFGLLGLFLMQKLSTNNRHICTYLGRLWLPDKDIQEPGFYKCYTYEEYYEFREK